MNVASPLGQAQIRKTLSRCMESDDDDPRERQRDRQAFIFGVSFLQYDLAGDLSIKEIGTLTTDATSRILSSMSRISPLVQDAVSRLTASG